MYLNLMKFSYVFGRSFVRSFGRYSVLIANIDQFCLNFADRTGTLF